MILFHGTIEENVKNIKKQGILDATQDQWITEVTQQQVCCTGSQPIAGEGGNPTYFAYGNPKARSQNGYLVVIDVPLEFLQEKVIAIFDNKILDDYVRYHFFPREEFMTIGYQLWQKLTEHKQVKDRYLEIVEQHLQNRPATDQDSIIHMPKDQRLYYTKVFDQDQRNIYSLFDIEFSDELYSLMQKIGKWSPFYQFLSHHFEKLADEKHRQFQSKNGYLPLAEYWKKFYQYFPIEPAEKKYNYFQDWFSPKWLASRQMDKVSKNCQILSHRIPPEYIKGFIQITTPSGLVKKFKAFRSGSRFISEIWKEALKIAKH